MAVTCQVLTTPDEGLPDTQCAAITSTPMRHHVTRGAAGNRMCSLAFQATFHYSLCPRGCQAQSVHPILSSPCLRGFQTHSHIYCASSAIMMRDACMDIIVIYHGPEVNGGQMRLFEPRVYSGAVGVFGFYLSITSPIFHIGDDIETYILEKRN